MYQNTAKGLAALGRNGDSMLMHVNPTEVAALSQLLGPVSTNPKTGLPEAYGWSNLIGSAIGGIGSFGIGESLAPIIGDAVGEGLMGDILKKAVPALAGAGFGAAIGGATGGKAGAMGGALQGGMSGGLGAYAAEDVFPQVPTQTLDKPVVNASDYGAPTDVMGQKLSQAGDFGYKPPTTQGMFGPAPGAGLQDPTDTAAAAIDKSIGAPEKPGFFDNLGTAAKTAFSKEGFKKYEDYIPYLFQAGMIGNAVTAEQDSKDSAQQAEEDARNRIFLSNLQATNLARQTYGYAGGGPVVMQGNDIVPIQVRIPEHLVDKVKSAGGMPAYAQGLGSYATGGYINLQPMGDTMHPQGLIPKAQPYPAATPQRREVVQDIGDTYAEGGLIDGEGDGMSDDIDANIEGREPVRVADGEVVVPKHIVDMIGVDRLDELLKRVRMAAYGREDQINEDAGLKAAKKELGLA